MSTKSFQVVRAAIDVISHGARGGRRPAITLVCLAFLFLVVSVRAEIAPAAQREIDQLVQQDKFTEALAKVDALLKDKPDDKDLLDLKAQLEKAKPASAPSVAATPKLKGEDRL